MKFSALAKIILAIVVFIVIAVLGALVQQFFWGKNNVAVTSALISLSAFLLWRLFRRSTK